MSYLMRRICANGLDYIFIPAVITYLERGHINNHFFFLDVNHTFFLIVFYFVNTVMYLSKGKTLGYLVFGLKIVDTNTQKKSNFLKKISRFLLKIIYCLCFYIPAVIIWIPIIIIFGAGHGSGPPNNVILEMLFSEHTYLFLIPIISILLILKNQKSQLPYEKICRLQTINDRGPKGGAALLHGNLENQ